MNEQFYGEINRDRICVYIQRERIKERREKGSKTQVRKREEDSRKRGMDGTVLI